MSSRHRRTLNALATALVLALPAQASAAFDAYLKLDGIEGESKDDKHKGAIVLESWSFGATNGAVGPTGARGAARPCLSDISVVKPVDKASPKLLLAVAKGQHIATGIIFVRKSAGDRQDFLVITMQDVLVTSVTHGASSGGGEQMFEAVSLSYASMTMSYQEQKDDGSLLPAVQATVSGKC